MHVLQFEFSCYTYIHIYIYMYVLYATSNIYYHIYVSIFLVYTLHILHFSHNIYAVVSNILFWFCMILIWPYDLVYIVWLAIDWFGFCHTWRTIAPPPLFSTFWGHRNSALFCSRVWPSGQPMKRIHQTFRSRCFYVGAWLIHVWWCFFLARSDSVSRPKEVQTLLCCFRGFDREAMTVLSHGTWSSTDESVVFMVQEFDNSGHVYPQKLCIVLLWHEFISLYVYIIIYLRFFLNMNSYSTDFMCLKITFW